MSSDFLQSAWQMPGNTFSEALRAEVLQWWERLSPPEQTELNELTRAFRPWSISLLPFETNESFEDETQVDHYEYCVNHPAHNSLPFFGRVGRNGSIGHYTALVQAIPLLDPDWPPYNDCHRFRSWEPRGKLYNADLSLDRPC